MIVGWGRVFGGTPRVATVGYGVVSERGWLMVYGSEQRRRMVWLRVLAGVGGGVVVGAAGAVVLLLLVLGYERPADSGVGGPPVVSDPVGAGSASPAGDGVPDCGSLPGTQTAKVVNRGVCADGDQTVVMVFFSYDCPDGRELFWSDQGWGYDPGGWAEHSRNDGQLVPPQEDLDGCTPG
jgi:hypothetical protein